MTAGSKRVLVTGGAGYIGSHTAKALAERGYEPVVFDNLSSGYRAAVRWGPFVHGDIRDERALREVMQTYDVVAAIHFASLIEVGRSVVRPDLFYDVNVRGTATLLSALTSCAIPRLVFSSTAAVYGQPLNHSALETLKEDLPKEPTSPYGDTKLACERMIAAHCVAFGMSAVALRYFNAAGADASGLIGEGHDPETHLIPLAIAAARNPDRSLTLFGDDFPTPDGTCLRDYIHVTDLAEAHVLALEAQLEPKRFEAANVGTGQGRSVREVVEAVSAACGQDVRHALGPRRAGDPPSLVADASRARSLLGWTPKMSSLETIVRSAAAWHANPAYGPR